MKLWRRRKVISFLASGRGLIFYSVAKKIIENTISARTGCVVTDRRSAQVLNRAGDMGIPAYYVNPDAYPSREDHEGAIIELFDTCKTDLVIAAGYLRLLSQHFINHYRNRIINIHPSLLPSFPGIHSQEKALAYGVKVTGCTAHFVDEGMDTGPIIMQAPVMVRDDDTVESLSARILHEEYAIVAKSVKLFCENRLEVIDRKVVIRT